jgi:hypothetical protein
VEWFGYDNASGADAAIGVTTSEEPAVRAPDGLPHEDGAILHVAVSAMPGARAAWQAPVHFLFRRAAGAWQLIGVDRG